MNTPSFVRWLGSTGILRRGGTRRTSWRGRGGRRLSGEALEMRAMLAGDSVVEVEPNDTMATATDLGSSDHTIGGLRIEPGDNDFYRWTAPQSGNLNVRILFTDVIGDLDLQLLNSNGMRVAYSDSMSDNEQLSYGVTGGADLLCAGLWLCCLQQHLRHGDRRSRFVADSSGSVRAEQHVCQCPEFGGGDQTHTNLTLHTSSDEDWFKWTASIAGPLTIDVLFTHSQGNVDVQLLDANQNVLKSSSSSTDNEQITHTVIAGQSYYVRAYTPSFQTQRDYDLLINGPEGQPPGIQILDDGDIGFTLTGGWGTGTLTGVGSDYRYSNQDSIEDTATWTFTVVPGQYRVSAAWPTHPSRDSDVRYTVLSGGSVLAIVDRDQELRRMISRIRGRRGRIWAGRTWSRATRCRSESPTAAASL